MNKPEKDSLAGLYRLLREEPVDDFAAARLHRKVMGSIEEAEAGRKALGTARAWRRLWAPLATAAALALVVSGVLWVRGTLPGSDPEVQILSVQANGGVHLEWSGAGKEQYQVLKSTDPADFSRAERLVVRGTRYTDERPGTARVIYYRVD